MSERVMPAVAVHGATRLPSVDLDSYNIELKNDEGFLGDRASKGAFREIIHNWRKALRQTGGDPLGDEVGDALSKKELDDFLERGEPGPPELSVARSRTSPTSLPWLFAAISS
jgi:hypothetical protein